MDYEKHHGYGHPTMDKASCPWCNEVKEKRMEWIDDLIWCPSQCYATVYDGKTPYTLYLRWRHEDPWQGHFIKNTTALEMAYGKKDGNEYGQLKMSGDLFRDALFQPIQFSKTDDLEIIKRMLEYLWFHRPDNFEELYFAREDI